MFDNIIIKNFTAFDIKKIFDAFAKENWHKPISTFEKYLQEQENSERLVWIAWLDNQIAGYITLKWQSSYAPFRSLKIPEIMDLNVLSPYRRLGIGSRLLDVAEKTAATKYENIGIGVGLYGGPDGGYGAAQRLYVKRGYVPDGNGVTYNFQFAVPGNSYALDDDLVLWFTKKL